MQLCAGEGGSLAGTDLPAIAEIVADKPVLGDRIEFPAARGEAATGSLAGRDRGVSAACEIPVMRRERPWNWSGRSRRARMRLNG